MVKSNCQENWANQTSLNRLHVQQNVPYNACIHIRNQTSRRKISEIETPSFPKKWKNTSKYINEYLPYQSSSTGSIRYLNLSHCYLHKNNEALNQFWIPSPSIGFVYEVRIQMISENYQRPDQKQESCVERWEQLLTIEISSSIFFLVWINNWNFQ